MKLTFVILRIRGVVNTKYAAFAAGTIRGRRSIFFSLHHYNQVVTIHGVIIIIFILMPFLLG
ncbi:hypothetical protein [Sodalis endosymbiont of Henestaris halophilus]|uniref:hypothetical protein n=1 Tax=Sodalis endosymbiont of Henestaris halophilus TaxID=1929246 RepID=UPI0012FD4238|nr:hypothetical protein [Sodalis endosymbiont of Henestaris halophilus]